MNGEEDGVLLNLTDFNMKEFSGGFFSELFNDENCLGPSPRSPSPSSCVEDADTSWIQQIETMLFNDDNIIIQQSPSPSPLVVDDFFADIDFPKFQEEEEETPPPPPPPKEQQQVTVEDEILCDAHNCVVNNTTTECGDSDKTEDSNSSDEKKRSYGSFEDKDNDPISKKRKRQLRNRDAAVKSRERKKMYVKDLELKSKYLEGECIRLQRLLQFCSAENHALHLQLQDKAFIAASRSKQESAVLLLESLLLGSLLWFLGMLALFSPLEVRLHLPASKLERVDSSHSKVVDLVALGRAKSKSLGLGSLRLFFKSKRCKASRSRMRFLNCNAAVLAAC